jgi:YD repeat-containing protein
LWPGLLTVPHPPTEGLQALYPSARLPPRRQGIVQATLPAGNQLSSAALTLGVFGDLSKTGSNGGTSFAPTWVSPNPNNQIASVGGQAYSYDANGNLLNTGTGTGTTAYAWDVEGHLLSETPNGSATYTRTYDALGRLVETGAGSNHTQWVYDPLGDQLAAMPVSR